MEDRGHPYEHRRVMRSTAVDVSKEEYLLLLMRRGDGDFSLSNVFGHVLLGVADLLRDLLQHLEALEKDQL